VALGENRHAIGQGFRFFEMMGCEDDGRSIFDELMKHCPHQLLGLKIEPRRGLVEEQQLWAAANGHRKLRLTLLPSRELTVRTVPERFNMSHSHGEEITHFLSSPASRRGAKLSVPPKFTVMLVA